jgi:catechol 2,3-dioxygenase-like lactoylglutathione lyase family enzyme
MAAKKKSVRKAPAKKRSPGKRAAKQGKARNAANTKQASRAKRKTGARGSSAADVPSLFRINVEVGNLAEAAEFYSKLFGLEGRVQAGSRVYFNCGPVTLQVVDVASLGGTPHPAAKALYFTVNDLDAAFARAQSLACLSTEDVHGTPGGAISVRPWGERSFYAQDKWQNPLCFVEAGTVYPG